VAPLATAVAITKLQNSSDSSLSGMTERLEEVQVAPGHHLLLKPKKPTVGRLVFIRACRLKLRKVWATRWMALPWLTVSDNRNGTALKLSWNIGHLAR